MNYKCLKLFYCRAVLNMLYIMLETIRTQFHDDSDDEKQIREDLKNYVC